MNSKSIIFQILEWDSFHESSNTYNLDDSNDSNDKLEKELDENYNKNVDLEYKIRLYGRTIDGKSIHVIVENFTPFFYVEIPKDWTNSKAMNLVSYIKSKISTEKILKGLKNFDIVEKKKILWIYWLSKF